MASNELQSETGLFKPYVEAEVTLATCKNDHISGDVHQRGARLLRYLRLTGQPDSFNRKSANELAGLLTGVGQMFRTYPETIHGPPCGLDPYQPRRDQVVQYPNTLLRESLDLLDDALTHFLDTGDSRTAPGWAVDLARAAMNAREALSPVKQA